jgi:hypothetical protein
MSFIGVVETAHVDQGTVTNRHSKQAVKRPNGLLEGHRADFDITKKKQNDDRAPSLAKSSKITHLTLTCEGGAFGDLHKINCRTGSLGLIP